VNCSRITASLLTFLLSVGTMFPQEVPDWAKRDYPASADKVFAAALISIQEQRHEVKSRGDVEYGRVNGNRTVDFHVGITSYSWGYNMTLSVVPIDETHARATVAVSRSGGKVVSWGSGKKEVRKILAGIDAELAGQKAGLR
jgi:hypothetical protein